MIELLAPAGNLEKAKTAIDYGADAVYIGGQAFSLRSRASNFSIEQIRELTDYAHARNAAVHVTVNMIPHEEDLEGLDDWLKALDDAHVDAIIAASPWILDRARRLGCRFERHVSTQHSSVNSATVKFWQNQGMDRVVLGRECTMEQIRQICEHSEIAIEAFIHGGMCVSYSGRCVLSNHLTNRDANRGGCAQSCRWKYRIFESGPGKEELTAENKLFSMSSKDLRGLREIPVLMEAGVASLKIEGRMKSAYYLATVVSTYRRLIDAVNAGESITEEFLEELEQQLDKAENRPTGPGFLEGIPDSHMQLYREHAELVTQEFTALVLSERDEEGWIRIQVRNRLDPGQELEIFGPDILPQIIHFQDVLDDEGQHPAILNKPMQEVRVRWDGLVQAGAMIRKTLKGTGN
ncbi:U32 family peptidase [uncultured Faecalibaculum sp.]|uniref:peptidase U32 family protein n=1 Tax=uncultured Faecalibaculum sp. TaxID=1729681 RepID=UPI0026105D2A|nr:U32 family peptidase [uncultured Faecalibaculum sp.]